MKKRLFSTVIVFALLCAILPHALIASAATYSGECGAHVVWSLDTEKGVLTVSGSGDMDSFGMYSGAAPWYKYNSLITSVVIKNGVTEIGSGAFLSCTELKSAVIPDSVTSISSNAFADCNALTDVTIPDSVKSIGKYAFSNCYGIESLTIPEGIKTIEEATCFYCTGLTSIIIPASVTEIGSLAFYKSGLKDLYYCGSKEDWEKIRIENANDNLFNNSIKIHYHTHKWGGPVYTWKKFNSEVTATIECSGFPSHTVTETVKTTLKLTKKPTEKEEGRGIYYAEFSNSLFRTQNKAVTLPKIIKFKDVSDKAFYAEAVNWAVSNGVTNGTGDKTFSPDNKCTRGQVVTFLWRASGAPEPESKNNPFSDVKEDAYYYKAVLWAVENKVTSGLTPDTFGPAKECTRGQAVSFLWRANGQPASVSAAHAFTDVSKESYYYTAMLWAIENEITNGTSATTFGPGKTCTRGQVVTFLQRAFK